MSTITKEFTKEQLQQIIETDHVQCGEASSLARIALASLEAEPVAFRSKLQPPTAIGSERWDYTDHRQPDAFELQNCFIERLYTVPPAPVSVPDESAIFDAAIDICRKSDAIDERAWNHGVLAVISAFRVCRAAMLNKEKNNE